MGTIHSCGPNQAVVISGGLCGARDRTTTVVGSWGWAWWWVTDVQKINLGILTLSPVCNGVETSEGVPLTVTGVAQVKIMEKLLKSATEQFLGRSESQIRTTILQTLEGHLRAILSTLTVEQIYKDRSMFAERVHQVASTDLARMGLEILSFVIKDVYDDVQYLNSLGKMRTAEVKRDADIGKAEANRDAGIREAECLRESQDVKYLTDTKIELNVKNLSIEKAGFNKEVKTALAEAELAYKLRASNIQQDITREEMEIKVVERRKYIEVEEKEVERKVKESVATVKLPAEAEAYKIETEAQGRKAKGIASAEAESEKVKLLGNADARAIEAVGQAEAEGMRMKAEAFKQYGEVAQIGLVLEKLPSLAAQVAAPLAKTKDIIVIDDGGGETIPLLRH